MHQPIILLLEPYYHHHHHHHHHHKFHVIICKLLVCLNNIFSLVLNGMRVLIQQTSFAKFYSLQPLHAITYWFHYTILLWKWY